MDFVSTKYTPTQGKTDPIDVRASEIARREGRTQITEDDRKRAFSEMKEMSPIVNTDQRQKG